MIEKLSETQIKVTSPVETIYEKKDLESLVANCQNTITQLQKRIVDAQELLKSFGKVML